MQTGLWARNYISMKVGKSFKASDFWKQISVIATILINQFQSRISLARLNNRPPSGLRYFSLLYSDALWQKRDTTRVLSFFYVGRVSDTPRFRRAPTGFCFSPIALAVSADLLGVPAWDQKILRFSGLVGRIAKLSSKIIPTTRQTLPISAYDHCLYSTLAAEQRPINDVVHRIKG
jgi:hypothetical protein